MRIIQDFEDWKKAKEQVADIISDLNMISAKDENDCKAYPCSYGLSNEDIKIYGIICGGCVKYKKSVQLIQAQKQQKTAKQKLLSNFVFWKHKSK